MSDGCEWNPVADELSYDTDAHYRQAPAEVIVGANGQYRLCSACAALPRFRRFKKRPIVRHNRSRTSRSLLM